MVHEQRGGRRKLSRNIAKFLLLGKAVGDWGCNPRCLPIPLTNQHFITEWRSCVAATDKYSGYVSSECGAIGWLTKACNPAMIKRGQNHGEAETNDDAAVLPPVF